MPWNWSQIWRCSDIDWSIKRSSDWKATGIIKDCLLIFWDLTQQRFKINRLGPLDWIQCSILETFGHKTFERIISIQWYDISWTFLLDLLWLANCCVWIFVWYCTPWEDTSNIQSWLPNNNNERPKWHKIHWKQWVEWLCF